MAISKEREAVLRDVAESEIRNGGQGDTTTPEDILGIYGDVQTREEAERVIELVASAQVFVEWEDDA